MTLHDDVFPEGRKRVFHWKGRDRGGHELEGDLEAATTDEAIELLRARGVFATTIDDSDVVAPAELPPPVDEPPRSIAAQLAHERATQRPQRVKGVVIALAFAAASIGVAMMGPTNTYHCTKEAGGTGRCTVERRPLGLFVTRRETLAGVVKADTENQDRPVYRSGVTLMGFVSRLALYDAAGHTVGLTKFDETLDHSVNPKSDAIGGDEDSIRRSINDFLSDPDAREVSGWWAHSVPLVVAGAPMLIALLMLALAALSLFEGPTAFIYAMTEKLARIADAKKMAEWRERQAKQ